MMSKKITVILLLGAFTACGQQQDEETGQEVVKTINVETQTLKPGNFASYVRVVGTVETSDDIRISSEVNGRILRYNVEEGTEVNKGEVILKIDDAKLIQEKARLEAATKQALENYERLQRLYKEEQIGSEIDYLNAKYSYEQNKAALESIKVDLDNTEIKAPFKGVVETFLMEEGEMVSVGTPVVRLIGSDTFIATAGVPARYSNEIQTGDQVALWFDTVDSDTLQGTITYVGNSIDPQNRTFRIEVLLPKKEFSYKVDMIVNMRLQTNFEDNVIVVSEEFVYSKDDRYVAYVLGESEQGEPVAYERRVELGPAYQTNVIIREGLKPGEKMITIGSAFLDDGMRVEVFESDDKPIAAQQQ